MNSITGQLSFNDVRPEPPTTPSYESLAAALRRPGTPSTVSVTTAARVLGISRTTAYEAVRDGSLKSVRIRRRIVIPVAYLLEVLSGNVTDLPNPADDALSDHEHRRP
jgi:excisionase family DNA binding protein